MESLLRQLSSSFISGRGSGNAGKRRRSDGDGAVALGEESERTAELPLSSAPPRRRDGDGDDRRRYNHTNSLRGLWSTPPPPKKGDNSQYYQNDADQAAATTTAAARQQDQPKEKTLTAKHLHLAMYKSASLPLLALGHDNVGDGRGSSSSSSLKQQQPDDDNLPLLLLNSEERREHRTQHALLLRQPYVSLERLNPDPQCRSRKSSATIAMINLVATVCGGGVLSLPLCFARAGVVPTTLLMLYGAVSTDFTLYLLVACARRTGGRSYGDVAQAAFGKKAQIVTTTTLGIMLCGSLIAYQVLVRQIWSPVMYKLAPPLERTARAAARLVTGDEDNCDDALLFGILVAAMPLLLKRDLHALRYTCYVGFLSCVLLALAVVYRAVQKLLLLQRDDDEEEEEQVAAVGISETEPLLQQQSPTTNIPIQINWYSTDPADIMFAFPIVLLCFFCSYNVLSVHSQLIHPTRRRVRSVLDWSMLICFALFFTVGLCGYLYAGNDTLDNILLNFGIDDKAILAGRSGYCLTLLFGLPLILLPCREAWVSIPDQVADWRRDRLLIQQYKQIEQERTDGEAHVLINGVDFDEAEPVLVSEDVKLRHGIAVRYGSAENESASNKQDDTVSTFPISPNSSEDDLLDHLEMEKGLQASTCMWKERACHVMSTIVILAVTYVAAVIVPDVAAVWSIFGSSMAVWIGFIVPTACYLKIREHKGITLRSVAGALLLLLSCYSAVICTRQAIENAMSSS